VKLIWQSAIFSACQWRLSIWITLGTSRFHSWSFQESLLLWCSFISYQCYTVSHSSMYCYSSDFEYLSVLSSSYVIASCPSSVSTHLYAYLVMRLNAISDMQINFIDFGPHLSCSFRTFTLSVSIDWISIPDRFNSSNDSNRWSY
jgi:hypothetical protein